MNLEQRKLSKEEWESLEVPVSEDEKHILKLIYDGFDNPNITYNSTKTLLNHMKLSLDNDKGSKKHKEFDMYLYKKYFKTRMDKLLKIFNIENNLKILDNKNKIKKADLIRIDNFDSKLDMIKEQVFEFVLFDIFEKFLKSKNEKNKYYYTLKILFRYKIKYINVLLKKLIVSVVNSHDSSISKSEFIENAYKYIEMNNDLIYYKDTRLYNHQLRLFTECKNREPKLILYQAPTGMGKTLSPIGLSKKYRIIFVCAAKHVGLQLAKSCISMNIKIAVAFGCKDIDNIRLHWSAAKETTRNRKTGGIFRVDNSVGDNVEIMISDIQSYLHAMRYMKAFNQLEDLLLYWDEPTITLDYKKHDFHKIMKENWENNEIPNVILSSATLPKESDIQNTIDDFIEKFSTTNIISISSHECSKTIPIINSLGNIIVPHLLFKDYKDVKECISHILNYKTLLRHLDVREITKFITYVNNNCNLDMRYELDNYFECIELITINNIKKYYLKLLTILEEEYEDIYNHFKQSEQPLYKSTIKITTNDAHTLTDGPTIYLADNVDLIGKFCLKTAGIPSVMFKALMEDIKVNEKLRLEIEDLVKEINKNKDNSQDKPDDKVKDKSDKDTKEIKNLEKCNFLRSQLKRVQLGKRFIPNSKEHLEVWNNTESKNAFTSCIQDHIVEKIMLLDVNVNWKFLLLMGIGVFTKNACDDYVAIMKELALHQHLYLIIASTDYIYGTNYQFCHGYIGKDLKEISQEKIIQAIGRVGRKNEKNDYSIRFRYDETILKLFTKTEDKTEADNMNNLFRNKINEDDDNNEDFY